MLYTKMHNVQIYVIHEYEMCSIRTYVTYENEIYPNVCFTRKYVWCQNYVTCESVLCPSLCYTRKYDVACPNLCYIWKCVMSEHELHAIMRCFLSEFMLLMKMWYVRTYVANENTLSCVRSYVAYDNVLCLNIYYPRIWNMFYPNFCYIRKIFTSEIMLHMKIWFLVQNVFAHDNVICLKLCHPRKYDVLLSELTLHTMMSEHMLHTNVTCILSELTLHREIKYVRTYVTHAKCDGLCPNFWYIRKCVISEPMLHTKI